MPVHYSKESAGPETRRTQVLGAEEPETEEAAVAVVEKEATPAAADLAQELGVDLAAIEGTGKDGKITAGDVRAADGLH